MKKLIRTILPMFFLAWIICGCGGGGSDSNPDPRLALIDLINNERIANGLSPLTHNLALSQVAQAHADDMVARNFFDHVNPDGHDFFWRVTNAGISYSGLGENIAAGFANMDDAHDGFMASTAHRDNVLRPEAKQVGIGIAQGLPSSIYGVSYYVVELFLQP